MTLHSDHAFDQTPRMLDASTILPAIRPEEPRWALYRLIQAELLNREREDVAKELAEFMNVAKVMTITAQELELLQLAYDWLAPSLFTQQQQK